MSKALVIRGANFSTNKLATIEFEDIPCTGVTLNKSAAALKFGETLTLVADVTPVNTTDTKEWTSSDETVATVENGIVSFVKGGTAVITCTCGTVSASCTVSCYVGKILVKENKMLTYGGNDAVWYPALTRGMSFGADWNERNAANLATDTEIYKLYPYPIPEGAKTVTVTAANCGILFCWFDTSAAQSSSSDERLVNCAKCRYGETFSSGKDWSIGTWTYDTRTVTIPTDKGKINAFTVGLYGRDASAYSDITAEDVGISFGY